MFNDPDTLDTLIEGLHSSIFAIHLPLVEILTTKKNLRFSSVTIEDEKKAEGIYKNLKKRMFDAEQEKKIAIELINLDPYENLYYEYITDHFEDYKEQAQKIGRTGSYEEAKQVSKKTFIGS